MYTCSICLNWLLPLTIIQVTSKMMYYIKRGGGSSTSWEKPERKAKRWSIEVKTIFESDIRFSCQTQLPGGLPRLKRLLGNNWSFSMRQKMTAHNVGYFFFIWDLPTDQIQKTPQKTVWKLKRNFFIEILRFFCIEEKNLLLIFYY